MENVVGEPDVISEFKSPLRILVKFFQRSRDQWKEKYVTAKTDIKRFKNQASDARRSREMWKQKAQLLEAQVQQLEAQRLSWEQDKKHPRP